jgi:hypothetical protein
MKRVFLSAAVFGATIAPALAGDGGGGTSDVGALLIQAVGRLIGKLSGMF